jgi:TetR/AcrR family transcriptional regulator, copper-responsive repressor
MTEERSSIRRGRPRAYDPDEALERATDAFWRQGYSGTSLDALSAATRMNRPSLYGAFGDKHALYAATLERYIADGRRQMEAALDERLPVRDALMRVYDGALAMYFPSKGAACGCFLIGTAVTEAMTDTDIRERLGRGLDEFDRLFERRIRYAQTLGELSETADPGALAGVASALLHSLAMRSRAGDSRAALRATAAAGVALICGVGSAGAAKPRRRSQTRR